MCAAGNHYMRPVISGELPAGPVVLQVVPWVERRSDDSLKGKEGMAKVGPGGKVHLILVDAMGMYSCTHGSVHID